MRKGKLLSIFLATQVLMLALLPVWALAYTPDGDSLATPNKVTDIFINTQSGSGYSADDIADRVSEKLAKQGMDADSFRVLINSSAVNTLDTSGWYVYDHYDTQYWGDQATSKGTTTEAAWQDYYNMDSTTNVFRPATFYTEYNYSSASDTNATKTSNPTTIEQVLINGGFNGTVFNLREHVYAFADAITQRPGMQFVGYGSPAYADFLIYPAPTSGEKNVKFTVDSSLVNTHSLQAAGFLINSGIGEDGVMNGYFLYYAFSGSGTNLSVSSITLYKINANVSASTINNGDVLSNCTKIDDSVTSVAWSPVMNIELEITQSSVTVMQKADDDASYTQIADFTGLDVTGSNGFGPFVHYQSHNCQLVSAFRFSDLEMALARESDTIEEALQNANYLVDSEKYFVDLRDADTASASDPIDWEGSALLRQQEIYYITNAENPLLNDGDGVVGDGETAPLGSNGKTITDTGNPDSVADAIVAYIMQNKQWDETSLKDLAVTKPVSIFSLAANPTGEKEEQVLEVVLNYLNEGDEVSIYAKDMSVAGADTDTIVSREYAITGPGGLSETKSYSVSEPDELKDPVISITSTSETGTYTVTQTVTNSNNETSSSTRTFEVTKDETDPTTAFSSPANASNYTLQNPYTGDSVSLSLADYGEGVMAYAIGKKGADDSEPVYDDDVVLDSAKETATIDYTLPVGEYTLYVKVWDKGGNETTVSLPVRKKLQQHISGTDSYMLQAGVTTSATLDMTTDNTEDGAEITYQIFSSNPADAVTLTDNEVTARKTGTVVIRATAAATESYYATTKDITIKIITPLHLGLAISEFDSDHIALTPSYKAVDYALDNDSAVLEYRRASDSEWTQIADWDWGTPTSFNFVELHSGTDYEVRVSARDIRPSDNVDVIKTVSFRTPAAENTNAGVGELEVTDATIEAPYSVSISKGNTVVDSNVYTPADTTFNASFSGLADGYYHFVVADKNGNTVTQAIQIVNGVTLGHPTVSVGALYTRVDILTEETPDIVVGGLPDIYDAAVSEDGSTGITQDDQDALDAAGTAEIWLTAQAFDQNSEAIASDMQKIKAMATGQNITLCLDLSLFKTITPAGALETTTKLVSSPVLLTVAIPLSNYSGYNVTLYRVHEGVSEIIPQGPSTNANGEYFELDNGYLVVYSRNFSTYAIAYTPVSNTIDDSVDEPEVVVHTSHKVYVPASVVGGTISPSTVSVEWRGSQTFTFTPDDGYYIKDVIIDGVSVGPVSSYTFKKVRSAHRIEVDFEPLTTSSESASSESSSSDTGSSKETIPDTGSSFAWGWVVLAVSGLVFAGTTLRKGKQKDF